MATSLCPNCGCNLRRFEPYCFGNIAIDGTGDIFFADRKLALHRNQHVILEAIILAKGRGLTRSLLADLLGNEIYDQSIIKYIERIRSSLREIDPDFNQIETMKGFAAYRWLYKTGSASTAAIASDAGMIC